MLDLGTRPLVLGAHYLLDVTARRLERGQATAPLLDEVFESARALGACAVRTMAAHFVTEAGPRELPGPGGALGAVGLEALDAILAAAVAHDVRLVLSLGNSWDDYGGARTLVELAGLDAPVPLDGRAYVHPAARSLRRRFVHALLSHTTRDGHRVGTHPAVLAWEPLNEPRAVGLDREGLALEAWLAEECAAIAAIASGVPVSSGEEGLDCSFEGRDEARYRELGVAHLFAHPQSFRRNASSPHVTWPSVHVYPEAWGAPLGRETELAERFVRDSARIARDAGKRLFVGEVGGLGRRWEVLGATLRAGWAEGAIVGLWMLRAAEAPEHADRYAFDLEEARAALRDVRGATAPT